MLNFVDCYKFILTIWIWKCVPTPQGQLIWLQHEIHFNFENKLDITNQLMFTWINQIFNDESIMNFIPGVVAVDYLRYAHAEKSWNYWLTPKWYFLNFLFGFALNLARHVQVLIAFGRMPQCSWKRYGMFSYLKHQIPLFVKQCLIVLTKNWILGIFYDNVYC